MDYRNQSLGALAIAIPRATKLFRQYNLDFCCGGKQTLLRAANKKELDIEKLEAELAALQTNSPISQDWQQVQLGELIDFIIHRYHERHHEQLTELIIMAEKVERVHGKKPGCPRGLTVQLEAIYQEMSEHMQNEEQLLFPLIQQGLGSQTGSTIALLEAEHEAVGQQLNVVKQLTQNVTPPVGACNTWCALYSGINEFINDTMEHIHLENNLLFPRALQQK